MASISPSPNYAAALPPPDSSKSPPPQPSPSPPPPNPLSSPSPENASQSRSNSTASTPSPLIASPLSSPSPPPPMASMPATPPPHPLQPMPPPSPPVSLPSPSSSPPPPPLTDRPVKPPPTPPPSPPPSDLPASSPPPPISNPPATSQPSPFNPPPTSPPPPSTEPPPYSPPPPPRTPSNPPPIVPEPPNNAPPPPTAKPPRNSPPPPRPQNPPPESSPPPPTSNPPENMSSPPTAKPPQKTHPPPPSIPPETPSPPNLTPPPPASPTSSNSPPRSPPPPPITQIPPLSSSPSPPSPALVPPLTSNTNTTIPNVLPSSQSRGGGGISTGGTIAIGLVLAFFLLSITGTAAWCIWKRKKKAPELSSVYIMPNSIGSSPRSDAALLKAQISLSNNGSGSVHHHSRSFFTYEQLVVATNGFSPENLLGEGGFGSVYKGTLPDGKEVAVKLLKVGGQQGEREFGSEVEIINRIHHRHLVSLVGYCISDNRRLLVFDYVANDTLYFHLHGESRPVMDWPTRVKIAIGAARGIAYLHEDCHPRIIHRDIKSSNILLDNNLEARVSDFGLAKLAIDTNTHITTRVMGTFGYMAPEYASSGKLTEKSDVFSFGVVLLELITGRKPVDTSQPLGDESLVEWARPLLCHARETEVFEDLADPRLERNYVDSEMSRLIEVAAACIRHSAARRPKMGQVVRALDSMAGSDLTNGMRLGESEMFNSAQQSEEIRLFRRMAFGSQNYSTDYLYQSSWSSSSEPSKY